MAEGYELTDGIVNKIKNAIRTNASPRHVPTKILVIPDVPYTHNMKKVELAVKKVVHNQPVLNKDSLRNPEALDYYADIKELQED
jgi:acetoacetyl-CoA synthetase